MTFPIVDLHCDLLFYLELDPLRTAYDAAARCALPQLHAGGVKLQTLAVFTRTGPHSVEKGLNQVKLYQTLPVYYPKDVVHYVTSHPMETSQIGLMLAFENASGFCNEQESLKEGINRLRKIIKEVVKPLYVSLTWNSENRFGGGALTKTGLKEDGKRLLDELHAQRIAIDFSHTSDQLAYDIFDYIEGRGMNLPVVASHSNARAIRDVPRNLPNELAREIFRRGGIIGMNFFRNFLGESEESVVKHLAHWLELGGEDHIAMGGDFFNEADLSSLHCPPGKGGFFETFQDASCYGRFVAFLQKEIGLSSAVMEKFSYRNALTWIKSL